MYAEQFINGEHTTNKNVWRKIEQLEVENGLKEIQKNCFDRRETVSKILMKLPLESQKSLGNVNCTH